MSKISTAVSLLRSNRGLFMASLVENFGFLFGDKKYLELLFRCRMGFKLDLANPKTFSEKIQWLKLYDRNPKYTSLVDKYEVKKYVAERIGKEHVIKTINVWDSPEEVIFDNLPNSFVLKTTHGGGNSGVIVIKDKSSQDINVVREKMANSMMQDLYKDSREWPYKNVKRRIIAEEYVEDEATKELRDYKFFCFNGEVKFMFVGSERQKPGENVKFDFFDSDYNHLDIQQGHPNSKILPDKPSCFDTMKEIASKLSVGIPHVRVDLYEANGIVFFGEMTFYHFGGMVPFVPEKWDTIFGEYIELPNKTI